MMSNRFVVDTNILVSALLAPNSTPAKVFEKALLSGNATKIITGDPDLLVLHPFQDIPIITASDFLADK